ncbi:MAG: hypothetical protein HY053_06270, partial [Proteobacteria bacterium]|nr:hypothetical protein [Pseudomonadota bacterium]
MLDQSPALYLSAASAEVSQKVLADFFAAGGLTVYATSPASWRWRACAGCQSLEAVVIDPQSLIEKAGAQATPVVEKIPAFSFGPKPFERATLVRWLTNAVIRQSPEKSAIPGAEGPENIEAYAGLIGMRLAEWEELGLKPALSVVEIRHFAQGHNVALSDIESAFLPGKFDLPPALAQFYIRHLTQARRDTEAALLIAQSCGSLRIPSLMADALAVSGFEAGMESPTRYEGNDYAASAAADTSAYIDEAVAMAAKMLALPANHPGHLLRLSMKSVTEAASDIVARLRPPPFAFLLKAKELYVARSDVCRFPPMRRFLTALGEGDLPVSEPWVQRLIMAYERLFAGCMGLLPTDEVPPSA